MKDWEPKDFRKVAFAVGLGLTLGKAAGETINVVIDATFMAILRIIARHGNKQVQQILTEVNVKWDNKSEGT